MTLRSVTAISTELVETDEVTAGVAVVPGTPRTVSDCSAVTGVAPGEVWLTRWVSPGGAATVLEGLRAYAVTSRSSVPLVVSEGAG